MKSAKGRKQLIREELLTHGAVEFAALAERLEVSEMTIRRGIDSLEAEGVLRRVLGDASALGKIAEPTFQARSNLDVDSKLHIAAACRRTTRTP